MTQPLRRIWLCADDYGLSPGVGDAIRRLIAAGRLNATSVMVRAPGFDAGAAAALDALRTQAAIGLHVTLTSPFRPATDGFRPLQNGAFPPIGSMLVRGLLRRLDPASLLREVTAQFEAFRAAFGRPPDFVDGHQHVHHVPQASGACAVIAARTASRTWGT